jgi:hypothetical protein
MSNQTGLHQLYHDGVLYKDNQAKNPKTFEYTCLPKDEMDGHLYRLLKQLQNQAFASLPLKLIVPQVAGSAAFLQAVRVIQMACKLDNYLGVQELDDC